MNIRIRQEADIVILDLEGNIDINASNFIETVGWVLLNKSNKIICNFEAVNIVDYIGVSLIAVAYKNVINHKGEMLICSIPTHVQKLFEITGLDRVFTFFVDEKQAIRYIREEESFRKITSQKLRRRFKRIELRLDIEYKQKFSLFSIYYKGKILNLSAIGVFVICEKLFSVGEILQIRFKLPTIPDEFDLDAKVIWIADKDIQPLESPGMGLEFYNISSLLQQKILEFVEKNFANLDLE